MFVFFPFKKLGSRGPPLDLLVILKVMNLTPLLGRETGCGEEGLSLLGSPTNMAYRLLLNILEIAGPGSCERHLLLSSVQGLVG